MTLNERIAAFAALGDFFSAFSDEKTEHYNETITKYLLDLKDVSNTLVHKNGWFTPKEVTYCIKNWAETLTIEKLNQWLSTYDFSQQKESKKVAIIMAGNIPMVGFHDLLCSLLTGHEVLIKCSSNDKLLIQLITKVLCTIDDRFTSKINFTEDLIKDFDAVIATGSNNTARYFEYYFKEKPSIIRKNRNSVAVLTGKESKENLISLGEDVFRYYGLGCRSVSKLFVPKNYDFKNLFEAFYHFKEVINEEKYINNYDYNKAVYLMSNFKLLDNGFLILKEDPSYSSPIASLFYEYYDDIAVLEEQFEADEKLLQCVVNLKSNKNHVVFGETQQPKLSDYADNTDTIEFMLKI